MSRGAGQGSLADALVVGGGSARLERIAGLKAWERIEALLEGARGHGS